MPLMDKRARKMLLFTIEYIIHRHSIKLLFISSARYSSTRKKKLINKPENGRLRNNVINKRVIE